MSEHTVYALAKTLQQTDGLERDLSQTISSLRETIEQEYLQKIRSAAHLEKSLAVEHPPREVTLLRAISAFLDDTGKQQIDRMTNGLLFLHTMQHIRQDISALSDGTLLEARSAAASVGEAPPSAPAAQMAGLLLALALSDQF